MNFEERQEKKIPEYIDGLPIGEIVRVLKSISYGDVRIVVQNSKVVQIDKTEKVRLSRQRGTLSRWKAIGITCQKGGDA